MEYLDGFAQCGPYNTSWDYETGVSGFIPLDSKFTWYADQTSYGITSCRAMPRDSSVAISTGEDETGEFEIVVTDECTYRE